VTAAVATVAAVLAGTAVWFATSKSRVTIEPSPVMRVAFGLPPGEELPSLGGFALSPDGALLAYASQSGGTRRLHVRTMSTGGIVDIPTKCAASREPAARSECDPCRAWLCSIRLM
jgi:hypothetical protein